VTAVATVRRPRPVLDRERERRLTDRQREILDELDAVFEHGFAHLTMADIAARLRCSLRTLYALAPSRDELVLIVLDRRLWRIGRAAEEVTTTGAGAPLDALRAYLRAATKAVSRTTEALARDIGTMPAAVGLVDGHDQYVFDVTRSLLDAAVARGDIADVDTAAVARVLAGLGRFLSRPSVIPTLRTSPKEAADSVVDLILKGLTP
jgi:AcrR family transcriptional regulator